MLGKSFEGLQLCPPRSSHATRTLWTCPRVISNRDLLAEDTSLQVYVYDTPDETFPASPRQALAIPLMPVGTGSHHSAALGVPAAGSQGGQRGQGRWAELEGGSPHPHPKIRCFRQHREQEHCTAGGERSAGHSPNHPHCSAVTPPLPNTHICPGQPARSI